MQILIFIQKMARISAHGLQHVHRTTKLRYFWLSLFVFFVTTLIVVIALHESERVTTVKVELHL